MPQKKTLDKSFSRFFSEAISAACGENAYKNRGEGGDGHVPR